MYTSNRRGVFTAFAVFLCFAGFGSVAAVRARAQAAPPVRRAPARTQSA